MTCGVYKMTAASGNFYIGSSHHIERRLKSHRSALINGIHHNRRVQGAYRKHGAFKEEILLICRKHDLIMYEQACLDLYKPEYNQSMIADRAEMTKETRAKLSKAKMGHVVTQETRQKIRDANKKYKPSPETLAKLQGRLPSEKSRARMSASAKRRVRLPHSAETRAKMGASQKGRVIPPEVRTKISASQKKRWKLRLQTSV